MHPRLFIGLATVAALSGCSEPARQGQADAIRVVAGKLQAAPPPARATLPSPAVLATPAPRAMPVRQLTVAESAAINTPEMWSEPLRP